MFTQPVRFCILKSPAFNSQLSKGIMRSLLLLSTMMCSLLAIGSLIIAAASATSGSNPNADFLLQARAPAATPFGLEYAFSVNLTLGSASSHIPIYGGDALTEVISKGTVTGPDINATIEGGHAFASLYKTGTVQVPQIEVYGTTSDGLPFQVREIGVGTNQAQMTRIVSMQYKTSKANDT
jgi:hypothetical protein